LRVERCSRDLEIRRRLIQREPVGHRIDLEQQIACANGVVFMNRQPDHTAADRRCDMDDVGIDGRIVGRRTLLVPVGHRRGDRAAGCDQRCRDGQGAPARPCRQALGFDGHRPIHAAHAERRTGDSRGTADQQRQRQTRQHAARGQHGARGQRSDDADQRASQPGGEVRAGDRDRRCTCAPAMQSGRHHGHRPRRCAMAPICSSLLPWRRGLNADPSTMRVAAAADIAQTVWRPHALRVRCDLFPGHSGVLRSPLARRAQ
jgi:hypothetical protein